MARGGGDVQIRFTDEGKVDLRQEASEVQIRYNQGPLLARDSQPDLPSYTELAVYETEIAEKGAPQGVMKGTSAMVSAPFGNGRVFLSSPTRSGRRAWKASCSRLCSGSQKGHASQSVKNQGAFLMTKKDWNLITI